MGQMRARTLVHRVGRGMACTVGLLGVTAAIAAPAGAVVGDMQLVSRAAGASGAVGNGNSAITVDSNSGVISGDDRYVVFQSAASNLTGDTTGGVKQVFVRDLQTGTVTLVSRASGGSGAVASGQSYDPIISRTGRYVVFTSSATNLVGGDTNALDDVFVRDLLNNTTTRVSVASDGGQANDGSFTGFGQLDITNDGRYVVFSSSATNLGGNTTAGQSEVYLHDLVTGTNIQVSRATNGAFADAESDTASITPDGHFVAFESSGTNLTATSDTNVNDDSFVRNLQTNTTVLVSHNAAGTATGISDSDTPSISDDGRYVSFASTATDLVSPATTGEHVFVRDLQTDALVVADRATGAGGAIGNGNADQGTPLSADGRYVAFRSVATNLVADDTNGNSDVFVRDLQSGTTTLVSRGSGASGAVGNADSSNPAISPDGAFIAFDSAATNLTSDTVTHNNVFLRQLLVRPPVNSARPAISGTPQTGQTVTCSQGTWTGPGPQTYAEQWNRDGSPIPGATGTTYVVAVGDGSHALTCTVTAISSEGSASATSPAVTVPARAPSTVPTVTRNGRVSVKARRKTFLVDPGMALHCPPGGPNCTASLTATIKSHHRTIVIAGAHYAFRAGNASGKRGTVGELTFTMNSQGAKLLRKLKHLRITLKVTSRVIGGRTIITSRTHEINLPVTHKRRRRHR